MSKANTFLPALFRMCNNDAPDHRQCILWNPEGTSFCVTNIERFSRDILPLYFKHNNYASFVRQLNMYGFHRSTEPKGRAEPGVVVVETFQHPSFVLGRADLLTFISRKTSTPSKVKHEDSLGMKMEPDLDSASESHSEVLTLRTTVQHLENTVTLLRAQNSRLEMRLGLVEELLRQSGYAIPQAAQYEQPTGASSSTMPSVFPVPEHGAASFATSPDPLMQQFRSRASQEMFGWDQMLAGADAQQQAQIAAAAAAGGGGGVAAAAFPQHAASGGELLDFGVGFF